MISGTIISISSNSWFRIWLGLEINLLSFIPLSIKTNNLFSSEASLKYFLTQALASRVLLFSILLFHYYINFGNYLIKEIIINLIFSISLIIKAGIAPFHFWFPNVIEGLSWINNLILITWQKIAPLIILSFSLNYNLFVLIIILSTFIGAIGGLNQSSLRKLIAFSSINHLGWILINILLNETLWKIYFIIYSFLTISIIFLFNLIIIYNIRQIYSIKIKSILKKIILRIPLLSLGGLPPFFGFLPKWLTIENSISLEITSLIFFIINLTLITLYFYLRICYSSILLNHNNLNSKILWEINIKNSLFIKLVIFLTIFGLLLVNLFS